MDKLRGILLDLDDTLYSYLPAHATGNTAANRALMNQLGIPFEALREAYEQGRRQVHARLHGTASSHNRLLYYQQALEHLGVKPYPLALLAYRTYWGAFCAAMQPFEGMYTKLAAWKTRGLRICLLTDLTADVQHLKIATLRLEGYLDALVTSEEVGAEKPDARMFEAALEKLGLTAGGVCMVGDNYDKDILGAHALGIPAWWRTPTSQREIPGDVFRWYHFDELNP
ncbi:MAG: HAD family hydrolase [Bacteroidetes bacterium]|nr:HAD family hydrolase [Bacteroidota bacterium]